jgi:hypothetical protein
MLLVVAILRNDAVSATEDVNIICKKHAAEKNGDMMGPIELQTVAVLYIHVHNLVSV